MCKKINHGGANAEAEQRCVCLAHQAKILGLNFGWVLSVRRLHFLSMITTPLLPPSKSSADFKLSKGHAVRLAGDLEIGASSPMFLNRRSGTENGWPPMFPLRARVVWRRHRCVLSMWRVRLCESGERSQLERHGHVGVLVPPGCGDVRRRVQDTLSHTGRLQKGAQLLPESHDGSKVLFIVAPGNGPSTGDVSQLGD